MKKIKEFLFGKNDWKQVWEDKAYWSVTGLISGKSWEKIATYRILFSFSRNRYKLKVEGSHPKGHSKYKVALDKLNHFKSQL